MKLWKILTSVVTCLMLVLVLLSTPTVSALSFDDLLAAATSGTCGENLRWALDKEGTLTISGTGEMKDYSSSRPIWYIKRSSVKKVVIEDGVTTISERAFQDCADVTEVTISGSVTAIGDSAFSGCTGLTDVYYDGTGGQWNEISIGSNNDALLNAAMHFTQTQTEDLNGDGVLNTDDAVYLLLSVLFGEEDYPLPDGTNQDFNNDGQTNTDDAVYLLLHVLFGAEDYPLSA